MMITSIADDYKYDLEDFSTVYIGANYTYGELRVHETIPMKYKEAVIRVFTTEVPDSMSIAKHLASLKDDSKSYMIYNQLRTKIKVTKPDKTGKKYETRLYGLREFMDTMQEAVLNGEALVEEIVLKKLHLVSFTV